MDAVCTASATSLLRELRSGQLSVVDYVTSLLARIDEREPLIHAWAHLDKQHVMSEAQRLDGIPLSERGPLHGIPVGIKDIFLTADMPTRFNSPIFAANPPRGLDATSVAVLRDAGALIIGKTATTQFASTTTGGPCINPHSDVASPHTPGGSSSGSAAAVADFQVPIALGTQTVGSIVRPASFCGIYGYKPTWGSISTEGMARYSTSCDTVGFFARSVEDFDVLASVFSRSRNTSSLLSPPLTAGPQTKVAMLKTHVWTVDGKASPNLEVAWEEARSRLIPAGFSVQEIELPSEFAQMTQWYPKLHAHECVGQFLGYYTNPSQRATIDHVIVEIMERGMKLTSEEMRETYDGIARLRVLWDEFAKDWDMIVTPSTTDSAPAGIEYTGDACFNAMWTALWAPCVGVPGLKAREGGLPIGLTVVGARWEDQRVLRMADALGKVLGG